MNGNADTTANITFGIVFFIIGSLVLLNELDYITLSWAYIVPIVLIVAGIAVIASSWIRRSGHSKT